MNNLTNKQIREILDGAPEGWTHYCTRKRQYFRRDGNSDRLFVWIVGTETWSVPLDSRTRWLERRERLEEILTLLQEVQLLNAQQSEEAARAVEELKREVQRSIGNMEYAAFNLCENMNLDSKHGGRTVETTCPEKSLLIAIRDLKEATGAR